MKHYPSIPHWKHGLFGQQIIAFDKLDGSNMRFEWSKKRGFHKFGTRQQMITDQAPVFGVGIEIFVKKYSQSLEKIFSENKNYRNCRKMTVYAEFLGQNSFAGLHDKDDSKDVILFDVDQFQKGILPPKQFVADFGHLHIPTIIYQGELTTEFVNSIRSRKDLKEGVVVKGSESRKGKEYPWMIKVKTNDWLNKVKEKLGQQALIEDLNGDLSLYEE